MTANPLFPGALRLLTPPDDPFSASLQTLREAYQVCFVSAYAAAQETLRVFDTLPSQTPKAFIYTGNTLHQIAIPGVFPFALGKAGAATLVEYGANAYGTKGSRSVAQIPSFVSNPLRSDPFFSGSTTATNVNLMGYRSGKKWMAMPMPRCTGNWCRRSGRESGW